MGGSIEIYTCGPLGKTEELKLPEKGSVAIIGPDLSGKSLIEGAISSAAFANTIIKDGKLFIGRLAERLVDDEWDDLYSLIDPMEYLSAEVEYREPEEYLKIIDETIRRNSDNLIGAKEYLTRMAFVTDLCMSRGIKCWTEKNAKLTPIKVELRLGYRYIKASLPAPNPKITGIKNITSLIVVEELPGDIVGINIGSPNEFLKKLLSPHGGSPSSTLAKILLKKYRIDPSPDVLNALLEVLLNSWKEISHYEVGEGELNFIEQKGEPGIKVRDKIFPWWMTSDGVINLLAHWYISRLLPILSEEGKVIIGLEEPEAHLDPYVAYKLPEIYARLAKRYRAVFIFSTHSEMLVKGIENAVRRGALGKEEAIIYETVYSKEQGAFTLKECPISEEGIIEGSRFTEIAWRMIEGEGA